MSWIERINNIQLVITTGDGKEYRPLWKDAKKNINFNTEGFDFIATEGTYVERKEVQGAQYPILLYFQGENCIDEAKDFEISARDKRPWQIKHPIYDDFIAQPLSLEFNHSSMNVVEVTGVVWETLTDKYPEQKTSPRKEVETQKAELDEVVEAEFVNDIQTPEPSTIDIADKTTKLTGKIYNGLAQTREAAALVKQYTNAASAAAQQLILAPTAYIREATNLINYPFLIQQDILQKVSAMVDVLDTFKSIFITDNATNDSKLLYQYQSTTVLSSIASNVSQSNEEDFLTRANVVEAISQITTAYQDYLTTLDDNGIDANAETALRLDIIINLALASLYDVAFQAKQERTFILDKDSNIVVLAHRFYGKGDENIELLVNQNNIHLNEYLVLKKGRKIVYYV